MRNFLIRCVLIFTILGTASVQAQEPAEFAERASALGAEGQAQGKPSVQGADEAWWFLTKELQHVGTGEFWKDWAASSVNQQDPVPLMLHFHKLLEAKGIHLLLVPIPAKASIYPEKVDAAFGPADPHPSAPFFAGLKKQGLNAIDLEPFFRAEAAAGNKMHCEQDAHYTPYACRKVAEEIAKYVNDQGWMTLPLAQGDIVRGEVENLKITGDQVPEEQRGNLSEVLDVQYCGRGGSPVAPDSNGPAVLVGDSHTLVFQEGASRGMHCQGAGLLDNLQVEIGVPIDLVGVRGSGQKAARVQLYRNVATSEGYWDNKKLVIWCFSAREFTQSFDKLVEVPIERK